MLPVILDLCGGTGSWSHPYTESGRYDVRLITLPNYDVREYLPPPIVHGILAAPPCTHFSNSGAQYWQAKDLDGRTLEDLTIVTACLRLIAMCQPQWWALENPTGRLSRWLGPPIWKFNPCDFGDNYTKLTYLWGRFTPPWAHPVKPAYIMSGNYIRHDGSKGKRYSSLIKTKSKEIRSITPPGFARAFYQANQ